MRVTLYLYRLLFMNSLQWYPLIAPHWTSMCGILLSLHRNDNTSYLRQKYLLREKRNAWMELGWMCLFQNKLKICQLMLQQLHVYQIKDNNQKKQSPELCIFVNTFPILVIWHLNMRNLINMKSITPRWEIPHHSRRYYHISPFYFRRCSLVCWGNVLLVDLSTLKGRRLVLPKSTRSLLNSLSPLWPHNNG